jgi:ABC-2 type transport system ATP-binding protein
MRQRLGIAQALVGRPEVLILDEPANGLDPEGIAWMRRLLRDFADRGGTVLLSSHLLHEVQATVDHLVVISRGAVVASGPMATLLASSGLLLRTPEPEALGQALDTAGIDHRPGPEGTFTVDKDQAGAPVTAEAVARLALDNHVLLTELRPSDSGDLEQLFFSLTATPTHHSQEAAA